MYGAYPLPGRTCMVKAGATFWTDKVIRSLRRRLDPVTQAQPPFTTMADSARKAALLPPDMA
jgi:hypothetical protein